MMERSSWMAVLARASAEAIEARLAAAPPLPAHRIIRGPEIGLTMLRGRAGGDGAAFNLGEATLTRCSVSLEDGTLGHCWRLGRDRRAAELAAVLDAALQRPELQPGLLRAVVEPIAAEQAGQAALTARRAAATEVRFATLATMR